MLESFAAWILNTYIGDYFGNVNTHQLRMSLKNGEIELESLPLKRDLIKHLGLPLEAKIGFIGKISIKFPSWHSFNSEPLVITIDELFLIVRPITNFTYNEEEENRAQQEFKMSQLDTMESRWKALHDEHLSEPSSFYSSSYSSWLNYGSSLVNNVLMNIHMKISSIHIRYEDSNTIPGCPFSTGVVIRSLTVCSTDQQWEPKFVTKNVENFLFKLINMQSFSCYCDTDTTLFGSMELADMVAGMRHTLDRNLTRKGGHVEHEYMIAPVNGQCRLRRNCSEMSLKSCQQPRTVIDVQLERVPIMMTAIQYKHLLDWSLAFQTQKTLWRYRKWRPMIQSRRNRSSPSKDDHEDDEEENDPRPSIRAEFDARTWWHFAVNANLEEYRQRRQRFNWHFILQRVRDINSYHRAYLHYLVFPESFSKEMRHVKDRIENELSLDELCSIREAVFRRTDEMLKRAVNPESDENSLNGTDGSQAAADSSSGYWFLPSYVFSNILSSHYAAATTSESDPSGSPQSEEQPVRPPSPQLDRQRAHSSSTEDIFLTRDAVYCQFNFQIHNSSFQLIALSMDSCEPTEHTLLSTSLPCRATPNNLLMELEFNEMKIGIDVTNPNAYACPCHTGGQQQTSPAPPIPAAPPPPQTSQQPKMLTQNELNQLQLDLNFQCQNLNLALLKTDDHSAIPISVMSDGDMQKLATAELTGCGLQFRFSTNAISIDGRLDSLELLDLVTAPQVNKHKRVLSIGRSGTAVEKALSFSLSRQMNENLVRVNIEMASFCYVHSALLVYELSLCRKCFSDVLEAYFSRAFKDRVKAATTEVLRGIVVPNSSGSGNDTDTESLGRASPVRPSAKLLTTAATHKTGRSPSSSSRRKATTGAGSSLFLENFKLNVFIRSPVIIFPIAPSSSEVVVFHLGHMLLNNHNHSSDIALNTPHPWWKRSRKMAQLSPNNSSIGVANSTPPPRLPLVQQQQSPPCISHTNSSYNAEIRDLSVYSLDCSRNVNPQQWEQTSVEQLYHCDRFGVPILQKTIIEIVLERKLLLSAGDSHNWPGQRNKPDVSAPGVSTVVDGLNLISSANSIDPLVLPKKFSIRKHFCPEMTGHYQAGDKLHSTNKPEMVLSIEISSIDVRFSYVDLLVFWHIMNTLTSFEATTGTVSDPDQNTSMSNNLDDPSLMEMIQELTISSCGLDAAEFRTRVNNLIDLGFNARQSIHALALKNGDIIEAAYMLSNDLSASAGINRETDGDVDTLSQDTSASASDGVAATVLTSASSQSQPTTTTGRLVRTGRRKDPQRPSNLLLSILSVVEVKILNGSIRIIDDCNQLELPLLELGVTDFRLMQYYTSPTVEAHAQTNFYCDYYNSHLSGWEPFVEDCQVAFSWKRHQPRCQIKSMLTAPSGQNTVPVARQKLAVKIEIAKMMNLNVTRSLLDLIEKVHHAWMCDIANFMSLPEEQRAFRHRQPFIPFALRNETGTGLQMFVADNRRMFSTGKAPDLSTPVDHLKPMLDVAAEQLVRFDCVDLEEDRKSAAAASQARAGYQEHRMSVTAGATTTTDGRVSTGGPFKVCVKVEGWQATFPLSIEREGTFVRPIVSERYNNQWAVLVFDISLQPNAVKLVTVRSSLVVTNRTTKAVELKFANTAMSDVPTSYMICPGGQFPVPLDLLYARMQLRPCDLGIGTCSTNIQWSHVKRFGEADCSLQICTPITHTQHGSYTKSQLAYVVSVLVERNAIGALIESRQYPPPNGMTPSSSSISGSHNKQMFPVVTTLPSHSITLLPPLQLANRLPYELRFSITTSQGGRSHQHSGTIKPGEDHSVHYISPLEPFNIEFMMEHFPRCRPLRLEPGAIKNYPVHIDMYDSRNRLLVLHAQVTVQSGCPQPSNAMTITVYAPYWIVNRSGLPLVFAQEAGDNAIEEAAGQYEEHEKARSLAPLLFSFADPDAPQYCIMRLGRMMTRMSPRWCNLFCLEKGAFYRRLRVTEYSSDPTQSIPQEKIYEFGIDIRQGRDRYSQTKVVTIAPRFQIENLTSFKLEFAQKCFVPEQQSISSSSFSPSAMSSPIKKRPSNTSGVNMVAMSALPKSNMPFHWPATDQPKLLCVRIASIIGCLWSGCFDVGSEPSVSFHLNIRDDSGRSNFVRVEILLQNATYFIVFTEANSLPPPIRVENFSLVAVEFQQVGSGHRTTVRPNSSMPYSLDEPTKPAHLTVWAPGGCHSTYDLNSLEPGDNLTYDNFYYLAFAETFGGGGIAGLSPYYNILDHDDDEAEQLMYMMMAGPDLSFLENELGSQMLVLDVPDDDQQPDQRRPKPVVLARKERGKRSQLWRQDMALHLIHEGSSPPFEPSELVQDLGYAEVKFAHSTVTSPLMVLDVLDDDHHGGGSGERNFLPLVVRQLDPNRASTQSWEFTKDGRLRCLKYAHMFVQPLVAVQQAENGSNQLFQAGSLAVIAQGSPTGAIPKEQSVQKQKMRKGSGLLNVSISADGPSRLLRIKDQEATANGARQFLIRPWDGSAVVGNMQTTQLYQQAQPTWLVRLLDQTELELNLQIDSIGVSVISSANEEIVFLFLRKIILELLCNPAECRLNCVVEDFQVDNQLLDCEKPVVLYVDHNDSSAATGSGSSLASMAIASRVSFMPAIIFNLHKLFIPNVEINVFKININDLVVNIEELVLLKLLEFINYDPVDSEMDEISSASNGTANALLYHASGSVVSSHLFRSAQYFFAYLFVQLQQIKLSVVTSTAGVSRRLAELKKKAGIKLIRFEEALIQLRPFHKVYSLMTRRFLQDSIHEHYRSELRSQARKILGTVDFLGNPVGFLNNLMEGLSEFYYELSIKGLIMNVTHGLSDSTAKVTAVLSESLGMATMDDRHQEIRRKIKQQTGGLGGQRSHLVVGAFGLAHGILGGITSVITQTYDGIVNHGGVTGFISGLSKGVLGTFTKPAVGMLDFASGAATAVRDHSRKVCFGPDGRPTSKRVRLPRTLTIDGRLTRYQALQSQWQARFYHTTDFGGQRHYGERFVQVLALSDRHFVLITTEQLYFFHAPLKKNHLAEQHQLLAAESSPVQRLQILSLEHFRECRAHRVGLADGQYFLQTNGTCAELTISSPALKDQDQDQVCHLIEFRQSARDSITSTATAAGAGTSSSRQRKQSFECPRHLNPCYVYCDCPYTVLTIVQLINEAKHLQQERKFEVSSLQDPNRV